jgi:hypothetical protein
MSQPRFLLAALLTGAVLTVAPAAHAGPDPLFHNCEGHVDYACTDRSGAFCTVWLSNACELGL